ncbi:hypothetical protein ASD00_36000 [Ensifer sp. Root31]|uniref:hypothetical protein n=1 Tax=Ensifer sp. Root31 TaxID=1736512 RepID=UPI00070B1032|nr:hypothetical protein [Ensifer sp. Root31]KQU79816.1 hypothetical protein ASD00_36000 [Ensifer sp. Root31]
MIEAALAIALTASGSPQFGQLAKAEECAQLLEDDAILAAHKKKAVDALTGLGASVEEAQQIVEQNLIDARRTSTSNLTPQDCEALK